MLRLLRLLPLLLLPLPLIMTADGQPELAEERPTHRLAKRMDLESCIGHFDVHKNTIIRTGESQAIGGKYLQGLELDTLEECERLCCETDACDVYIFERKAGGYCYLFECGPPENFHCKFTRHANYTSAVLTPQTHNNLEMVASTPRPQLPHIPSNNISQQEWELSNLKLKPDVQRDKPTNLLMPTTATTATGGSVSAQSVPLPHCGRFQFGCHSGECIAVYNACDGIPQCEDGSDEGPECNTVASTATKASGNSNTNNVEQYQPVPPIQQQLLTAQQQQPQQQQQHQQQQQQHVIVLGPPPPPPPPPPMVNNREDAAAWANRKMIAETQSKQQQQQQHQLLQQQPQGEILIADEQLNSHIFNHKGGLQLQQQQSMALNGQGQVQGQLAPPQPPPAQPQQRQLPTYNNNNNNGGAGGTLYGMSLPRSDIYLTPPQQQQPQVVSVPQQSTVINWPQVAAPPAPIAVRQSQQQQQSHAYITAAAVPPAPAPAPAPAAPQQSMLPVLNAAPTHGKNQPADEDYDDYEEEKSTEAPKKRKHKKTKAKSSKDPIELALEQNKQQQQLPALPVPVGPVHEQYKMIHENLALEFRDHDGHSERPGGAVLSLTLGLLVTAALAILIGCRMRTVGRRARRMGGKTPYSQEADFLVNGMYL
ncbi:low-density lipoprotein receptor-related protein 11 isoform X2 [Drosophila grimshawi]|uniref:low-density lipoprotein receptor-related protein 11 isoform X2 n=1 Tax=Drosophila grimshawi TaxID=7222 RepID=UPI000C8711CE|nr:low-density lipoprotein receptor-related protein 11 isoform X2 [Drosophila grimshawi]